MKISNQKILITGGASGIGLGLTEKFVEQNNTVIICGRRKDKLDEVAVRFPKQVIPVVCDVAQEEEVRRLHQWILTNHDDLDILINNAGIQNRMEITDADFYSKAITEISVNVLAPILLINLFASLPQIKAIMNVTSGLAFVPSAGMPVYCATKAFMRSFTLSLRKQFESRGIDVIEINPPALHTDLGGAGLHNGYPEVNEFITSIFQQLEQGSKELTFGYSKERADENNRTITAIFNKMNA
ncbi:SDR family NAD(P)-dependent oxidoreductase [Mucilaginibacter sp. PAMB04274]|uniref:SDR family oxidoreductase n=1 Tax=Mucilaginibacter sp. PAMB04274 TaxID=3138568 RepID=UPI0031F71698